MKKSRMLTVCVTAVVATILLVPATSRAASAPIVADSYTDASKPTSNYGTRAYVKADNSPVLRAYLKFDVSGYVPGTSAALRFWVESRHSVGVDVRTVADSTWAEGTITASNAPAPGAVLGSTGPLKAGQWVTLDVSSAITANGLVTFAIATSSNTAAKITSREGTNKPQLLIPAPGSPSPFNVTRVGDSYQAESPSAGTVYSGTLKSVVESAVTDLDSTGGGTVNFAAGDFDLGADHFEFYGLNDLTFAGAGMGATVIRNYTDAASDTEPFDLVGAFRVTIRDMTVSAGGTLRSTSDAIDFDYGNNSLVENVAIIASRARGIIFDGKGAGWTAVDNTVRNCVISGVPGTGIELLASSQNTIEGNIITDVGRHGIQVAKASTSADQPNKKSTDNVIRFNIIDQAGLDGINVNSGDRNLITLNQVTNSSDDTTSRDGIRIGVSDSQTSDDNTVSYNVATDDQTVKTQRYGLNIASTSCNRTVVGGNDFAGNLVGEVNDLGTGTVLVAPSPDTAPPSVPTDLVALAINHDRVDLTWTASTDNVGVTGYTVYRDGVSIATIGPATSYTDTSVLGSTTYAYEVEAFDAATNASGHSDPVSVTTPATPSSITLTPVADAYVDASSPSNNYGASSSLRVDGSPVRVSYIRFEVSGVSGSLAGVVLRILATSSSNTGHDVWSVADNSWDESTINWENAPVPGSIALGSSGPFAAGAWVEVDVSSFVTGNGTYTLALTTPSSTAIAYASGESATPPELVIQAP